MEGNPKFDKMLSTNKEAMRDLKPPFQNLLYLCIALMRCVNESFKSEVNLAFIHLNKNEFPQ